MNSEDRKELGKQLARERKKKDYTQGALAARLGITRPHLSDYETGRVLYPTFEVLLKAATELNTEFVVAGYRLTKDTPRRPEAKTSGREKQLTFSFYKGRAPKDATIRVTTFRTSVVIKASVAAAKA